MVHKLLGNNKKGTLFIVSAPAGTGKTTLVEILCNEFHSILRSISFTTRKARGREVHGVDYYFISEAEFQKKINQDDFLEYAMLYDNYYGTSKDWVEKKLNEGYHVVLVIDTQGAKEIKKKINCVSIFIRPPSLKELTFRLLERKTESEGELEKRLNLAKTELEEGDNYDYQIVNDDIKIAYKVLASIFIAEEHKSKNIKGENYEL